MHDERLPEPRLPLRLGALLTINPRVYVRVTARADALQIAAPFGDIEISYSLIMGVATEADRTIRLDLSGATLHLDFRDVPDIALNVLVDLLRSERRVRE